MAEVVSVDVGVDVALPVKVEESLDSDSVEESDNDAVELRETLSVCERLEESVAVIDVLAVIVSVFEGVFFVPDSEKEPERVSDSETVDVSVLESDSEFVTEVDNVGDNVEDFE